MHKPTSAERKIELSKNDVWAAFCAYTKKSGRGFHYLKLYDDNSGGIFHRDELVLELRRDDGFSGMVAKIKAATR